jgi:hypothetical protein
LINVNKSYSPGQKNQCYLFCIMRKFVQCGKYFRSHAVPPYTSFTVFRYKATFRQSTNTAKIYTVHCYEKIILLNSLTGIFLHARPALTAWFTYIINGFVKYNMDNRIFIISNSMMFPLYQMSDCKLVG